MVTKEVMGMEKISQKKMLQIPLNERVEFINERLKTKSLKQVVSELECSKSALKEMLEPYQYDISVRRYELPKQVISSSKENKNQEEITTLLFEIKELLQTNNNYQKKLNETVTKLDNKNNSVEKNFKPQPQDELITRSFKIYDSINERLKLATKNSELNQQKLFNKLLHQALQEIGF